MSSVSRMAVPAGPAEVPAVQPSASYKETPIRVLVVDDDEASLATVVWAIAELGDNVRGCLSASEALLLIKEFQPDVALLDLGMPHMNGLELCRALRADPSAKHLKIIAQTGRGDRSSMQETATAGFDLHLVKPLKFSSIADIFGLLRGQIPRLAGPEAI